jgi:Tfp pilus assembly protein PilO
MKDGLKYQKWYATLVHYPRRYRLYLTLLILLALVSFWQILLYKPFNRAIQFYRAKNKSFQGMLQESNNAQLQNVILSKTIQGLQQDLKGYQTQMQDVNEVVALVVKEARQNNLVLLTCRTEPLSDHEWYQAQSICIEIQGSLSDIMQWVKKLSEGSKLLSMPSVSITQVDKTTVRCSATIQCERIKTSV